jgi:hypothetical protein
VPHPSQQIERYLWLWISIAIVAFFVPALRLAHRYRHSTSSLDRRALQSLATHFGPSLAAGALLTLVVYRAAPESLWMLPALWALCYGLGVFAVASLFPRGAMLVGWFYLLAALFCLALARGEHALAPWTMGIEFGCGQLLAAAVLYFQQEREDGSQT